jgi:hypothetical protein
MNPSTHSSLESLEAKLAPAGLVTITLTTSGAMTVTGDGANNEIAIINNGNGSWSIQDLVGSADTFFSFNGSAPSSSSALTFIATSIKVDLGAGDDSLYLGSLATSGSVSVKGGSGEDSIILQNCVIAGSLTLDAGSDLPGTNNGIAISSSVISGATSLKGSKGGDEFAFDTSKFFGTVTVDAGDGGDLVSSKDTAYANNFNIRLGSGNDGIAFDGRTDLAKGLNIDFGTGTFILSGQSTSSLFVAQGNVSITAATAATDATSSFNPLATLTSIRGNFSLKTGNGQVSARFGSIAASSEMRVSGLTSITLGSANDDVFLESAVSFLGGLQMNLGNGNNNVFGNNITQIEAGKISITSGSGEDSIILSGSTANIGSINLSLGGNTNLVDLLSDSLTVNGDFSYTGGADVDQLNVLNSELNVHGKVSLNTGNGNNFVELSVGSQAIVGSISYKGGTARDIIEINAATSASFFIGGNTDLQLGTGDRSEISLQRVYVSGALKINSSASSVEQLLMNFSDFAGNADLNLIGNANGFISIQDVLFNSNLTINTGSGNDDVLIDDINTAGGYKSAVANFTRINLGSGDDTFRAGNSGLLAGVGVNFLNTLRLDGGDGFDGIDIAANNNDLIGITPIIVNTELQN